MKSVARHSYSYFGIIMLLVLSSQNILAHTSNEETLFPDIAESPARFDILMLVGVGIIPESANFHPDNRLSRNDLAAWGALSAGLAEPGEVDINALARMALEQGLFHTLSGDATYQDINNILFEGQLLPGQPDMTPTRAEAATFIASNIDNSQGSESLLARRDMRYGPTGHVSSVESKMNPDGGTTYYITVEGETHPVYSHGKVANGPTDLGEWKGRHIRRSIIRQFSGFQLWVFLEAEEQQKSGHTH